MSQPNPGAVLRGAVDLSSLRARASAPAAPTPASAGTGGETPGAPALVFDMTDATFPQVAELSRSVPVVVDLWATWCGPCTQLSPILEKVVTELAGRLVLAKVDVDANPQLQQAFRAQSIPMVVALVGGQALPLFTGAVPEAQVREVFGKLLEVAAQSGVSGRVPTGGPGDAAEPAEPELPPLHQEAYAAIEAGDYAGAAAAYEKALAQNPHDEDARAGLGQVRLLGRVQHVDAQAVRAAAASAPDDVDAQLLVADLDVSGGHVEDAFARLLELFAAVSPDRRTVVRERLLELFGVVGETDPRVRTARSRLTSLLF